MTIKTNSLILAGALAFAGCGAPHKTKTDKETEEATTATSENQVGKKSYSEKIGTETVESSGSFALTEEEKEEISGQVEETLQSVVEETGDEDGASDKLQIGIKVKAEYSRNCEEQADGSALVSINRSLDRSLEISDSNFNMSRDINHRFNLTRAFSKDGQDIHCHFSKKFVDLLSINGLNGLSISSDFTRNIERERKTAAGDTYTAIYDSAGERSIKFAVETNESGHQLTATIESDVVRKLNVNSAEQGTTLESRIRTNEEYPLVVIAQISSQQQLRLPSSLEIASGMVEIERANGTKIETQFDHVKLDFTKGFCERRSGTIDGKITRADGSAQTYKVDFNEKHLVVTFADGSEKKLESVRCGKQ